MFRRLDNAIGKTNRRKVVAAGGVVFMAYLFQHKFHEVLSATGNAADITEEGKIFWIRHLFGRIRSSYQGEFFGQRLPVHMRESIYQTFARVTGADLSEARFPLDSYHSVNELFARTLKDGARPPEDPSPSALLSPVDGVVMRCGPVRSDRVEQVKGSTYNLRSFLGENPRRTCRNPLAYIVLYLPPGAYHHFHAPSRLEVQTTRHFAGETIPVFKGMLSRINDILSVNERIVLVSEWAFGKLFLGAVGSYGVGTIKTWLEPSLKTNEWRNVGCHYGGDVWSNSYDVPMKVESGGRLGNFRMGSTVVLVFEVPSGFSFSVSEGQSVKVGQRIGRWPGEGGGATETETGTAVEQKVKR